MVESGDEVNGVMLFSSLTISFLLEDPSLHGRVGS